MNASPGGHPSLASNWRRTSKSARLSAFSSPVRSQTRRTASSWSASSSRSANRGALTTLLPSSVGAGPWRSSSEVEGPEFLVRWSPLVPGGTCLAGFESRPGHFRKRPQARVSLELFRRADARVVRPVVSRGRLLPALRLNSRPCATRAVGRRADQQVIRALRASRQLLPPAELPTREHLGKGRVDWHFSRTVGLDGLLNLSLPVERGGD